MAVNKDQRQIQVRAHEPAVRHNKAHYISCPLCQAGTLGILISKEKPQSSHSYIGRPTLLIRL